jgi:hypothetical protein
VNGGNTIYKDASGTWHLDFVDFSAGSAGGVLHATSSDGWVQDGERLYGLLCGAGAVATLDQNQIFHRL